MTAVLDSSAFSAPIERHYSKLALYLPEGVSGPEGSNAARRVAAMWH
jgi:hypothetical protein